MTRYYCSGFDANNAFGYGLGKMFKQELQTNLFWTLLSMLAITKKAKVYLAKMACIRHKKLKT